MQLKQSVSNSTSGAISSNESKGQVVNGTGADSTHTSASPLKSANPLLAILNQIDRENASSESSSPHRSLTSPCLQNSNKILANGASSDQKNDTK